MVKATGDAFVDCEFPSDTITKDKNNEEETGQKDNASVDDSTEINWESKLTEDDFIKDDKGNKFVPLKSLERLARQKGWIAQDVKIVKAPSIGDLMAVVEFRIEWTDGTVTVGCGDAHKQNCNDAFRLFITSMAETRAYCRALRRGLGITTCSYEEIATERKPDELEDLYKATEAQIQAVARLLAQNKLNFLDVLNEFGYKEVIDIPDLTSSQATQFIGWLQSAKARKMAKKIKDTQTKKDK